MRARSSIAALMGAGFLATGIAADGLLPAGPAPREGLWELRRSSNIAMFVAPPRTPEDRTKLSDEFLRRSSVMHICQTAEQHKAFLEKTLGTGDCTPQGVQKSDRVLTMDMVCKNSDKVHAEIAIDPSQHRATGIVETIVGASDGKPKGHIEVNYESPEHASVAISMAGPPPGDVPLIMKYDLHWVSADCGGAATGKIEPDRASPGPAPH